MDNMGEIVELTVLCRAAARRKASRRELPRLARRTLRFFRDLGYRRYFRREAGWQLIPPDGTKLSVSVCPGRGHLEVAVTGYRGLEEAGDEDEWVQGLAALAAAALAEL